MADAAGRTFNLLLASYEQTDRLFQLQNHTTLALAEVSDSARALQNQITVVRDTADQTIEKLSHLSNLDFGRLFLRLIISNGRSAA